MRCLTADPTFNQLRCSDRHLDQPNTLMGSTGIRELDSRLTAMAARAHLPIESCHPVYNKNNLLIQIGEDATVARNTGTHSTNISCVRWVVAMAWEEMRSAEWGQHLI